MMKLETAIRIQRQGWYLAIYLLLLLTAEALAMMPVDAVSNYAYRILWVVMFGQLITVGVLMIGGVLLTEHVSLCELRRQRSVE